MERYHFHFHLGKFFHDKYNDLVISDTLRTFGLSIISLFLPVFLLQTGFSLKTIVIFELCLFVCSIPLHFLFTQLLGITGTKKMFVVSYILSISQYAILYFTSAIISAAGSMAFLIFVGAVNVLSTTSFWISYHHYFIKSTKIRDEGKKYAILVGVPMLLGIASPFVGSLLISNAGFELTFLVTGLFLIAGTIALFGSREIQIKPRIHLPTILRGHGVRDNLLLMLEGATLIGVRFVWPVLLFVLSLSLVSIGLLYLLSNLFYVIISYVSGKAADMHRQRNLIRLGAAGHGITMISRAIAASSGNTIVITGMHSLSGVFAALWLIPFRSHFYRHAHHDPSSQIMNREIYTHAGRIITMGVACIIIFLLPTINALITILFLTGILTFCGCVIQKAPDRRPSTPDPLAAG